MEKVMSKRYIYMALWPPTDLECQYCTCTGLGGRFWPPKPVECQSAISLRLRNKGVLTTVSKKGKAVFNAPDNKGRRTGLIVHVLPQEKLNIDVIVDVFGIVEKC